MRTSILFVAVVAALVWIDLSRAADMDDVHAKQLTPAEEDCYRIEDPSDEVVDAFRADDLEPLRRAIAECVLAAKEMTEKEEH
jgi:hypothetical protein